MLVHLGETVCRTPEDFKAWSQNLGHEAVLTTFRSYGEVSPRRQQEILEGLKVPPPSLDVQHIAKGVAHVLATYPPGRHLA